MPLAFDDRWIWDSWHVHAGGLWHVFFLEAPKALGDPEARHWTVSIGHATSPDLSRWRPLGTCFRPAPGPAWDDFTTWTGSVVRGPDALWHLFYTGTSRAERGLVQRIGHAVSEDLHDWRRVGAGPCLDLAGPAAAAYEVVHDPAVWHDRALRDPWVMPDPGGEGWLMVFTARAAGVAEANAAGAIGLATSPDLHRWTLEAPVFVGGYGQLEVPQVIRLGRRWYCLFSTDARHAARAAAAAIPGGPVTGTHYLEGAGPRGPWRIAAGPFLDGAEPAARYAGRLVETADGPCLMTFVDRPEGRFVGTLADPIPLAVDADGRLRRAGGHG